MELIDQTHNPLYIGRTEDGGRYFVDATIRRNDEGKYIVTFSGEHVAKYCREPHAVGQNEYYLDRIITPSKEFKTLSIKHLKDVWDKYHLHTHFNPEIGDVPQHIVEYTQNLINLANSK